MNKIEKSLKDLKTEIDITNRLANTNFALDDEDIFKCPIYLLDKETDKLIAFNFPRDIFIFLFGIRYQDAKIFKRDLKNKK